MKRKLPTERVMDALRCPICKATFSLRGGETDQGSISLVCSGTRRHCYDLSSSGYANFMPPGHTDGGDAKAAVRARTDFLNAGLYQAAAEKLEKVLQKYLPKEKGVVLDAGCGEGYYTCLLAKHGYSCVGFDLSKAAVDASAKRIARAEEGDAFFGVGSVFELPVADASCAAIVNIFAPCAEDEFFRVLSSGGILLVAYAGPCHLMGLKQALYETVKKNDERADLPKTMELIEEVQVKYSIAVEGQEQIQNLFAMTPYYWRTSPSDSEKLKGLERLETEVDMIFGVYRKTV